MARSDRRVESDPAANVQALAGHVAKPLLGRLKLWSNLSSGAGATVRLEAAWRSACCGH